MKVFEALGTKKILYRITVIANSKTEAAKKIRKGEVVEAIALDANQGGFALGGAGHEEIKDITNPSAPTPSELP